MPIALLVGFLEHQIARGRSVVKGLHKRRHCLAVQQRIQLGQFVAQLRHLLRDLQGDE